MKNPPVSHCGCGRSDLHELLLFFVGDALDFLDEQARADYIKQYHAAVMDTGIPAYERMMEGLEKLREQA